MKIRSNTPKESIFKKIGRMLGNIFDNKRLGIILTFNYICVNIVIYHYAGNVILLWIIGLIILFNIMFTIIEEHVAMYTTVFVFLGLSVLFATVNQDYEHNDINVSVKKIKLSPANNKLVVYLNDITPSMMVIDMTEYSTDFYKIEQLENDGYKPKVILTETISKDLYDIFNITQTFNYNYTINFNMVKDKTTEKIFSRYYKENDDLRFDERKFINK